jgi:glycogen synthase
LSTLEAMMTGTPIIAPKTGGLTRQVVDHRDESENGVALDIDFKTLVGSQTVPYIYEDYVHNHKFADAIMKLFEMSDKEKKKLSIKVKNYANSEFGYQKTIDEWHSSMMETIANFKTRKNWQIEEI